MKTKATSLLRQLAMQSRYRAVRCLCVVGLFGDTNYAGWMQFEEVPGEGSELVFEGGGGRVHFTARVLKVKKVRGVIHVLATDTPLLYDYGASSRAEEYLVAAGWSRAVPESVREVVSPVSSRRK